MPNVLSAQERAVLAMRSLYESYGYTRFPMRRFEEYAFYLENKSFLRSESVLSFTDANGRLMALKPDVTLSIVKQAQEDGLQRLYYNESVYRLSPTDHEFTEIGQIGVEMLGEIGAVGACEVLRLAVESLRLTGVRYVLDIGHMGFAAQPLAALAPQERQQAMRLIRQKNAHELSALLDACDLSPQAAALVAALPQLSGSFEDTLPRARALAFTDAQREALDELKAYDGALRRLGLNECARLDLSVLNDLDYYNGLVFQGYIEGAPRMVLSGGRYDRLMRKLGKKGGGLGFALYLDEVGRVLSVPAADDADVLALYAPEDDPVQVLSALEVLRGDGLRVYAASQAPAGFRAARVLRFANGVFEEVTD